MRASFQEHFQHHLLLLLSAWTLLRCRYACQAPASRWLVMQPEQLQPCQAKHREKICSRRAAAGLLLKANAKVHFMVITSKKSCRGSYR
ncbi:hypothetical protein GUJ93_ZPchr0012g20852 [Zizania palustris]|uniref:Secreted protein n=1 Tax=Zizania palustris TaxID=103762 RepID=A0A8J6BV51_ZIZPA|nr:hypothetical protein GUJ93_ZPchr0012g20852 [Zizania palustris]